MALSDEKTVEASQDISSQTSKEEQDVFTEHPEHNIHYKTLSWQFVSFLMITEIVSNGMLSLPAALAVVGIVPAVILIAFLGAFALFTARLLIDFKLNHPNVHTMGDAGYILGGPIAREILSLGTVVFAICGTSSELLSGQLALQSLSNNGLCGIAFLGIFSGATFVLSLPRTLDKLRWLGFVGVISITLCGFIAMIGAGVNPIPGRVINATLSTNFYQAFLAITNPVFAYAGHFMFFILISEMKQPQDAMKAAWCLQVFATLFYIVFAVVIYVYIGSTVASPALLSLPIKWAKATWAIALPNFLFVGGLYAHTAAKLVFVRLFRHSRHLYSHTKLGWATWTILCFTSVGLSFLFVVAIPVFAYLIGIAAALFASWYTYGVAGFFWIHDTAALEGGVKGLLRRPVMLWLSVFTVLAGAFMCVAGTYVSVKLIVAAHNDGLIGKPFTCG